MNVVAEPLPSSNVFALQLGSGQAEPRLGGCSSGLETGAWRQRGGLRPIPCFDTSMYEMETLIIEPAKVAAARQMNDMKLLE